MLYKSNLFLLSEGPQEASIILVTVCICLERVWLQITGKLTNKDLIDRELLVLQLIANLGMGSPGIAEDLVRPLETCVFHLSVQPSLE